VHANARWAKRFIAFADRLNIQKRDNPAGKNRTESRFLGNDTMDSFRKAGGHCQTGNQPDRAI
jgi:hypothetical protein